MPELPEVETIVKDLNQKVLKRTFVDVWTDYKKIIKNLSLENFRKKIKGKKIRQIQRRGKNIIFGLSEDFFLLIHQKLTGHLLYGKWEKIGRKWVSKEKGFLNEKVNSYIHLILFLDNGKMIALSDLRKFAKVELEQAERMENLKSLRKLGPEPLKKSFTFKKFRQIFQQVQGRIKQVLMNQEIIAGIGNIYSDEILWEAKIHPFKDVSKLKTEELKAVYRAVLKVLRKAVKLRGTSVADFRDIKGKEGFFAGHRKVYQREGEKCSRCRSKIKRLKIGGRSAHYCPKCQKK